MITSGGVIVDARLYETAPVVREGLLLFRPEVADMSAHPATDELCNGFDALVTGIRRSAGYGPTDLVRRLRLAAPALGIFVVAKRGELSSREQQRLAALGVDRVLCLEGLNKKQLGRLVERRLAASAPERALAALSQIRLDPAVAPVVQWTLRNACYRLSIEDAAVVFWLSSRTLRRWLDQHEVPGYRALRTLGLQLHALELEVCRGVTKAESARRLGFRDVTPITRLRRSGSHGHQVEPTWFTDLRELYD